MVFQKCNTLLLHRNTIPQSSKHWIFFTDYRKMNCGVVLHFHFTVSTVGVFSKRIYCALYKEYRLGPLLKLGTHFDLLCIRIELVLLQPGAHATLI